jgi:putative phosphoribosyl transferase
MSIANNKKSDKRFPDRNGAGQLLAEKLRRYAHRTDVVVVALAPAGVPVGYEIANALDVPFDVLVIRHLGLPNNPALSMGAVSADGAIALNNEVIRFLNIRDATIDAVIATESIESLRLDQVYCGDAPHLQVRDKAVILVDDGIATTSFMRMAVTVLRLRHPAQIVIAVPVANASSVLELRAAVNDVVTCKTPDEFDGGGQWYEDFRPIAEESVRDLYERARRRPSHIGGLKPKTDP